MEGEQEELQVDETHPMHHHHPNHPDNHHHRLHHPHAQNIRGILGVYVLFTIVMMGVFGVLTNAPFGPVILFFAPAILLGMVGIGLLGSDHFDMKLLGLSLILLITIAAVAFSTTFLGGIDVLAMVAVNLIFGALLLLIIAQSYHQEPTRVIELEVEQQEVPDLIKTIEDRCKAMNFTIGRVYSIHHGASKGLREKIKVDNEWYNELTKALENPEEDKNIIVGALEKIRRRLRTMQQTEAEVFSDSELNSLKKLDRDAAGLDRIIDVLARNDSDPVQGFHKAALEYCEILLERLTN